MTCAVTVNHPTRCAGCLGTLLPTDEQYPYRSSAVCGNCADELAALETFHSEENDQS